MAEEMKKSLELALYGDDEFLAAVRDIDFARAAYDAMCNTIFVNNERERWSASMRYVGGMIATARDQREDYTEFYLYGGEDQSETHQRAFQKILARLGWRPITPKEEAEDYSLLLKRLEQAERIEPQPVPVWFADIHARRKNGTGSVIDRIRDAASKGQITEERYSWMMDVAILSDEAKRIVG